MLPAKFDGIFARYAGRVPVPYLRALSKKESNMNPRSVMPGGTGAARGLMQVVGVLREDFNKNHGTAYTPDDLLDPEVSVRICAWLLNRIVAQYAKNFPNVRNMQADWTNPEFVKLVTAGWNAGYSRGGGVQRVVAYLVANGIPVTHDAVFQHAGAAGAVKWLQIDNRRRWQAGVDQLYREQMDYQGGVAPSAILAMFILIGGYFAFLR